MNKILALVMLLVAGDAFAASSEKSPFKDHPSSVRPVVYTECVKGQIVFVAASEYGVTAIQMFKDDGDMVPKPIECGDENE